MWQISKSFEFCYGHRVWSQELIEGFSVDLKCACRHLHGHNATVNVYLIANKLDAQGMVTDFKHLGWFKKWIDNTIDHKFIVDINDPLLAKLTDNLPLENCYFEDKLIAKKINYTDDLEEHLKEYYTGFIIVDFIPTSENLSRWLCEIVEHKMSQIDISVDKLEFFETPKSKSVYINN
ncbi:MAG: 6-pyruvoyltetrahydropterin/6-carboxytetrahydropterin synthase [Francisella sp.]|jgi:6-pyruvoyltetrahydropterin/6-carboxytetrahydropterin synthase